MHRRGGSGARPRAVLSPAWMAGISGEVASARSLPGVATEPTPSGGPRALARARARARASVCLLVMVTVTGCPTIWYSPPTISCEKRPDCLPPTRVAPFSLATLLALASSESGSTVVGVLKVLTAIFFLRARESATTVRPCLPSGRDTSLSRTPTGIAWIERCGHLHFAGWSYRCRERCPGRCTDSRGPTKRRSRTAIASAPSGLRKATVVPIGVYPGPLLRGRASRGTRCSLLE